jgi:hypothetical protein
MAVKLFWAYAVVGCLTLVFQIWVRSGVCGENCAISFAKAALWAIVWPLSWIVYLSGVL